MEDPTAFDNDINREASEKKLKKREKTALTANIWTDSGHQTQPHTPTEAPGAADCSQRGGYRCVTTTSDPYTDLYTGD